MAAYVGESSVGSISYYFTPGNYYNIYATQEGEGQVAFPDDEGGFNSLTFSNQIGPGIGNITKFITTYINFYGIKPGKVRLAIRLTAGIAPPQIWNIEIDVKQRQTLVIEGPDTLNAGLTGTYSCQNSRESNVRAKLVYDDSYLIKESEELSTTILGVFKAKSISEKSTETTLALNTYLEHPIFGELIINKGVKNITIIDPNKGTSFQNPIYLGEVHQTNTLNSEDDVSHYTNNTIYYSFRTTEEISPLSFEVINRESSINNPVTYRIYDNNLSLIKSIERNGYTNNPDIYLDRGDYYLVCEGQPGDRTIMTSVGYRTPGTSFDEAIPVSIESDGFYFSDARDLELSPYGNRISEYSTGNEIFYKLSLSDTMHPMLIRAHIVGSKGSNKYLHLATYDTIRKTYNILETRQCDIITQDISEVENQLYNENSVLRFLMRPGQEYYIIAEGYKSSNLAKVNTLTCVTIEEDQGSLVANRNSAPSGPYGIPLNVGNALKFVENTAMDGYYNLYMYTVREGAWDIWHVPSNAKEVYHTITIREPMDLIIHHNESELQNTCIHVIPMNDIYSIVQMPQPLISVIGQNYDHDNPNIPHTLLWGQAYVELNNLAPGTYCIISEGYSYQNDKRENGIITVNIEGRNSSFANPKSLNIVTVEEKNLSILLTPNPATAHVDLVVNTPTDVIKGTYQIIGINGGIVQRGQLNNKLTSIGTSRLPTGIYMIYVIVNGKSISERLIVK